MRVVTRNLTGKRGALEDWDYQPPEEILDPGDGGLTLRELISRIVREEVKQFHQRQRKQTFIQVLSRREIENAAQSGKVVSGNREFQQSVDSDEAVGVALQGFIDGLYLVFLDDVEQRDLDAQVFITSQSQLKFIPLTFLAGA